MKYIKYLFFPFSLAAFYLILCIGISSEAMSQSAKDNMVHVVVVGLLFWSMALCLFALLIILRRLWSATKIRGIKHKIPIFLVCFFIYFIAPIPSNVVSAITNFLLGIKNVNDIDLTRPVDFFFLLLLPHFVDDIFRLLFVAIFIFTVFSAFRYLFGFSVVKKIDAE